MSRYNEIMEHIKVTDEMRERIMENIGKQRRNRYMKAMVWVSAAAAGIALIVGAVNMLDSPEISQMMSESTAVQSEPAATSTVTGEVTEQVIEEGQGTRDNPEKPVTAGEFMERYGKVISVPEDIEILEYRIDYDIDRGYMAFYKDDVLWNAYVKPVNIYPKVYGVYEADYKHEIPAKLDDKQVTAIGGVEPELHYYKLWFGDEDGGYQIHAEWYLDDWQFCLIGGSDGPIHTMPVEIFDVD
ncbi:MAG: hypothetical protein ILP19_06740 [Oscillospiraceae bacterium]|nr:hypothetical protein [Oscillospiraceae bacterium]